MNTRFFNYLVSFTIIYAKNYITLFIIVKKGEKYGAKNIYFRISNGRASG